MFKILRHATGKMLLPVSVSAAVLFTGCGGTFGDKDTDEAKQYEAQMALDAGDYDKAIALLEDGCAGYAYAECQLQLGSAYLGKAGMDIISLGSDLIIIDKNTTATDAEKETQIMTVLFDIITDDAIRQGTQIYKRLLDQNGSECNGVDYDGLTDVQKNACIAVNPILLQEIMSESDTKTDLAVDIETIAQFKDVLEAVIPGVSTAELVSILDDSTPDASKDVNGNTEIDSMEATECAITAENGNAVCDDNVTATGLGAKDFTNVTEILYAVEVIVSGTATSQDDGNFTRLVTDIGGGVYSTVTTSGYCELDGTTSCPEQNASCYPCPTFDEEGNLATLSGAVTDVLNNDTLLTSIAIMSDSDDTKTSDEKVTDFKEEICYADYPTNTVYVCEPGTESDPVISQDALLDYMAR